jgi:hypothetical protein
MNKIFEKDEIKINISINSKGFVDNIAVLVKDEEFFNSISDDKREVDRVATQIFNTLNQILNNIKPSRILQKEVKLLDNVSRDCPNTECDGSSFLLVRPCCEEKKVLAKEGVVAVLECKKCKQRIWVKRDEYIKLIEGNNAT